MPIDKTWYLYILECKDGTLYTGVTTDVERRLHEHNNTKKGAKYTSTRRPVRLLGYYKVGNSRSTALSEECIVKKLSHRDKRRLITSDKPNSKSFKTIKRKKRKKRIFKRR